MSKRLSHSLTADNGAVNKNKGTHTNTSTSPAEPVVPSMMLDDYEVMVASMARDVYVMMMNSVVVCLCT